MYTLKYLRFTFTIKYSIRTLNSSTITNVLTLPNRHILTINKHSPTSIISMILLKNTTMNH